ncbi:MAG: ABC transporter permease, partial [Rhodothermales bacterium]
MLKNYLTVAWRHLRSGKAATFINVAGLALGMASCLLILLYVQDELRYDRFHEKSDRIFRLTQRDVAVTPAPLAPALAEAYPSVEDYVHVMPSLGDVLIKDTGQNRYYEKRFYWADSTLFDVFSFPLLQGDPRHALAQSGSLVITEAIAQKYFGAADPMGQTLIFDIGIEVELQITGVMQNPPHHSHFRPDFLASLALFDDYEMLNPKDWSQTPYHSYVVLDHPRSAEMLRDALPAFIEARTDELEPEVQLQPITEIHLRSTFRDELEPGGSLSYVYSFSAIALLILLIACINFINLSTARSAHRAREIGMRKVLGAQRKSLVAQFIGESFLLTLLALVLALPMVVFLLPFFNQLADKTLTLQALNVPLFLFILIGMVLLVGVVSGSYPAFFLSRFTPIRTLRGVLTHGSSGINVRKVLVVIQFVIGIMLMVGTLVIYNQLTFIGSKTLGFSTEQTLVIAARMYGHSRTPLPFEAMRHEFAAHPGVLEVAVTGNVPGTDPRQSPFFLEGMNNQDDMAQTTWNLYTVDYDFLEMMGIEVIDGRSFSRDRPADQEDAFLLNEAAWREARQRLGPTWDAPVGKKIDRYTRDDLAWVLGKPGQVIGVVRDFHYQSLHYQIAPLVLQLNPRSRDHFAVRLQTDDAPGTLARLEATWRAFLPERPFEYYFLDAAFDALYRAERR